MRKQSHSAEKYKKRDPLGSMWNPDPAQPDNQNKHFFKANHQKLAIFHY